MTTFVDMYHPALGNVHVLAASEAVSLYEAHGWLLSGGGGPAPDAIDLTVPLGDLRYAKLGDIPTAGTATGDVLRAAFVPFWAAGEAVTAGTVRVDATGHLITRNANGTTRSTYDATEQAAWTVTSSGGGGGGGAITSVNGKTGVVVLSASDVGADASGAATAAQAFAVQRANHTGTQSADTITDGTTNKAYSATEKTKLAGVATGATANSTDAQLRDRSTHTGTQAATTITGLAPVATSGAYTDLSGKPTIPAAGSYLAIVTGLSSSTSAGTANAALIQAALNAAATAGGGTVVVPAGTWTSAPLQLRTNVTLSGVGRWGSVLRLADSTNTHFITLFDGNTEMTGITDLMLDCNSAAQTGGNGVHLDNTSFTNNRTWPSAGDPNHYMRRVMIRDAKGHGLYSSGTWSQSHFDGVFVYSSGLNNFRIESPDNFLYNCVSAKSGAEGFYFASNSNHGFNLKSWLSGAIDAANGQGYVISGVDRIDLVGCEAQDNRKHGLSVVTSTQANIVGFRANRNGLGSDGTGGVGDGMFASGLTNSRIEVVAYDHNNGGLKQRWAYNLGSGNDGNIVTFAIGNHQDNSVPGIGSWGPGSLVTMTWLGKPVAQPVPPMPATTQTGTTYTLALADMGSVVESNNAAAVTVTVPPNSSVAFPIGTIVEVHQLGAGQVTVAAGAGVTLRSRGAALKIAGQYGVLSLRKRATDEWVVAGDAA